MKQQDSNTFGGGLNTDMNYMSVPNDVYIDALNATLTTHNGNEFILQTERGNTYRSKLPDGYYAIGVVSDGNIAYILSHNPTINAGQIGSYPSPDYSTTSIDTDGTVVGDIVMEYNPFRNYTGTNDRLPEFNIEFTTGAFNFDLEHPCDMTIQKDYDGTSNIIFTDNKNPVRIINSYFKVEARDKFRIIDRRGTNDTNIYNEESFQSTINHIARTATIAKLSFLGTSEGSGQLACGDYTYFFRYSDADGNVSDIIEQSGKVSIFIGTRPSNIRGGKPNELSTKSVAFNLENLDPAYSIVKVVFVYKASLSGVNPVPRAFEISREYRINTETNSVRVTHTGFEGTNEVDINTLSIDYTPISKAKTLTQIQGRLMLGNVVLQSLDNDNFKEIANKIQTTSKPSSEDLEDHLPIYYNDLQPISKIFNKSSTDTESRNLGYWSEFNIYDRLGYWDHEVYQFGIVFITNEGYVTSVYPIEATVNDDYTGDVDETNNFFNTTTGRNLKGVHLFSGKDTRSFSTSLESGYARGVRFKFSNLTDTELETIKSQTKGYFFVRAERTPLCIAEGVNLVCVKHANLSPPNNEDSDFEVAPGANTGAANSGSFYYPLVQGHLECNFRLNGNQAERAAPIYYVMDEISGDGVFMYDPTMMGSFIPDLDTQQGQLSDIFDGNNLFMLWDGIENGVRGDFFNRTSPTEQNLLTGRLLDVFGGVSNDPYYLLPTSYSFGNYVPDNNTYKDDLIVPIRTTFVSREDKAPNEKFQSYITGSAANNGFRFQMRSESYVGVNNLSGQGDPTPLINAIPSTGNRIETSSPICEPQLSFGQSEVGNGVPMSYRVRYYNSEDPFNVSILKDRFEDVSGLSYFPISERTSWEDAEANGYLENGHLCFGGDCYKQISYKRIIWSDPYDLKPIDTFIQRDPTENGTIPDASVDDLINGVPRPTATVMSIYTCNNTNVHLRDEDIFDINETATYGRSRFFFPYSLNSVGGSAKQKVLAIRKGEFKLGETIEYNDGYSSNPSDKIYFAISDSPFSETRYDTRIYYSDIHVNNQFLNGLRVFQGLNYQDYPRKSGEIVKLENINNSLIMIQERGIAMLGVNDRTIVGGDVSGSVFIDQAGVLHPKAGYVSEDYGCEWFNGIQRTPNTLYGIDVPNAKIWMLNPQRGLTLISDFKIESYLRQVLSGYNGLSTVIGTRDIVTLYNPLKKDIIFSGYGANNFTIVFNEDNQKWITKSSMKPYIGFSTSGLFNSMGVDNPEGIWEHSLDSDFCNYYGEQGEFIVEFTVKNNITVQKIFDNLKIISNNSLPIKIQYQNDNSTNIVDSVPRVNGNIFSHNIQYKENHVYVQVSRSQSFRVRDKYCNVRLIYTGKDLTFIQAVLTLFRYSYS